MDDDQQWDDFLPRAIMQFPSLSALDDQARCRVCKDYLTGPMMTTCGHTFCSLCIRRALNSDGRCPSCRSLEEESKLRKNLLVEEMVEAFIPLRQSLLKSFTTQTSTGISKSSYHIPAADTREDHKSGGNDIAVEASQTSQNSSVSRATRSSSRRQERAGEKPESDCVLCPVCNGSVETSKINAHIDQCLVQPASVVSPRSENPDHLPMSSPYFGDSTNGASLKSASSKRDRLETISSTDKKRLPKPNYAVMNDTKLRKAMADIGLSTNGTRSLLQKRYTEFIALWNSNLDSKHPKSKKQLHQDIQSWDRIQTRSVPRFSSQDITDAHENGAFDSNFEDLIQKARTSLKRKAEPAEATHNKQQRSEVNNS